MAKNNNNKKKSAPSVSKTKNIPAENSLAGKFIKIAQPNEKGFSKQVSIEDLIKIDPAFKLGNGGSWCRDESPLGKIYHIKRIREGNRIVAILLDGKNQRPDQRGISSKIRDALSGQPCRILATTNSTEIDHKNAQYNSQANDILSEQEIDSFQPLSKHANTAKRQHCKECQSTKKRFDAKRLGYSASYIFGDSDTKVCDGCYWHDPLLFNQTISKDYDPGKSTKQLTNDSHAEALISKSLDETHLEFKNTNGDMNANPQGFAQELNLTKPLIDQLIETHKDEKGRNTYNG